MAVTMPQADLLRNPAIGSLTNPAPTVRSGIHMEKFPESLAEVTHLGVGAHHDDLEFMAFHGILECLENPGCAFGGVVCTDGAGSSRSGAFAGFTDDQLRARRSEEQNRAAEIGRYRAMVQLAYPSASLLDPADTRLACDLEKILRLAKPRILYTHNPADKHRTHLGVLAAVIRAVRALPQSERPASIIGCEVWRSLDWMPDSEKIRMDVSGRDELAARLNSCFESQIASGKRYDLAVTGRRAANATFDRPHAGDSASQVILGMDLTPLALDDSLDPVEFISALIRRFESEVRDALEPLFPKKNAS
jgi:LmbE family N-acetylglucosaminyl deacetylase